MLENIAQRLSRLWARVANLNELPGNSDLDVTCVTGTWLGALWLIPTVDLTSARSLAFRRRADRGGARAEKLLVGAKYFRRLLGSL